MPMAIQSSAFSGCGRRLPPVMPASRKREKRRARALEEAAHHGRQVGVAAQRARSVPHVPVERDQQHEPDEAHVEHRLQVGVVRVPDELHGAAIQSPRPHDRVKAAAPERAVQRLGGERQPDALDAAGGRPHPRPHRSRRSGAGRPTSGAHAAAIPVPSRARPSFFMLNFHTRNSPSTRKKPSERVAREGEQRGRRQHAERPRTAPAWRGSCLVSAPGEQHQRVRGDEHAAERVGVHADRAEERARARRGEVAEPAPLEA